MSDRRAFPLRSRLHLDLGTRPELTRRCTHVQRYRRESRRISAWTEFANREAPMTWPLKLSRLVALCVALLPLDGLGQAAAEDYPTRPVRWILGFPPGGPTD